MVDDIKGSGVAQTQLVAHQSFLNLEPTLNVMHRFLTEFRTLENFIFVVTIFGAILTFAITAEGQLTGQIKTAENQTASNSSRRSSESASQRPQLLTELKPLAKLQPQDVTLDTPLTDDLAKQDDAPVKDDTQSKSRTTESTETDDNTATETNDDDRESARQSVSKLEQMKSINTDTRSLRVNIAETNGESPNDESSELVESEISVAEFAPSEKRFAWAAPDIRYQPLYFEDVALERYGQTPCGCELRQTTLSAAHFFKSAVLLPYQMIQQHPQSCDWPLGFCRPGTDTPFIWQKHIVR
jgi:hypothetical protein